ncbi:MAG: hypothetical protein KatS3mg076_1959 [Candidatus Binatia bacterium]|nr:MAG: hypothetical protein KatS3mg076_1959 [Candidatus Binatia bacterium]
MAGKAEGRGSGRRVRGLLLFLVLCSCGGGGGGSAESTITVNDPDFRGASADGLLSLSEAIELATGRRILADLTLPEREQIRGTPGRGKRDVIRFQAGLRSVQLRRTDEPSGSLLPRLDDPGDSIVGNGTVLDARLMDGIPQRGGDPWPLFTDTFFGTTDAAPLLVVDASDITVRGLVVENFPGPAILVRGARQRQNVEIADNVVRGPGRNTSASGILVVAGPNRSDFRLADVRITGNVLSRVSTGILAVAGSSVGAGGAARFNVLEGVDISENRFEDVLRGVVVAAAQAAAGGQASDNRLVAVTVRSNEFLATLDAGIRGGASILLDGGVAAANSTEQVLVRDNAFDGSADPGRENVAMAFVTTRVVSRGASEEDLFREILVEENVVEGYETGALFAAADADRCGEGCDLTENVLENVDLRGNAWRSTGTGVLVTAARSSEAAALVRENLVRRVRLEGERVESSATGLLATACFSRGLEPGAGVLGGTLDFPGRGRAGQLRGNDLLDVEFRDGVVEGETPVMLHGGLAVDTDDDVADCTHTKVRIRRSELVSAGPELLLVGGRVVGGGSVRQCVLRDVESRENRTDRGTSVALSILDQAAEDGAPPDSVRDNFVDDVRRN